MNKIIFEIKDDVVVKYTPISTEMDGVIYKPEIVMDKKIFQECYKKWVETQERSDME